MIAQVLPPACIPPSNLPGCGLLPSDVLVSVAIPEVAKIALNAIAALSVIFVIIGGARWLLSFGREDEHTKGAKTILWALAGVIVALVSHRAVTMVLSEQYVVGPDPLFELFATVIRIITILLNITFLLVIVLGGMRMMTARGKDEEITKARKSLIYAIVGIVTINVAPFVVKAVIDIL